jgi:hypothetical protein
MAHKVFWISVIPDPRDIFVKKSFVGWTFGTSGGLVVLATECMKVTGIPKCPF